MKKAKSKQEFPRIYRFITEKTSFPKIKKQWIKLSNQSKSKKIYTYTSIVLTLLLILFLISLTGFLVFKFTKNYQEYSKLQAQRSQIYGKINFWNSIAGKYPGYPDAYFNIAVLYYQVGEFGNSQKFLNKTLLLNPNYKDAKKLEEKLK